MLLGLARPTAGEALVLGRPYAALSRPATHIGGMLEAADLHPGRTGRDHLRVLAAAAELPATRLDDVLRLVELGAAADRPAGGYSLGMKQRLGLAAALLGEPELLVLDEPGNGLDPAGIRWLRDFLRAFASGGRTVFVSSHLLAEVAQTVDRVVIIDRGRLVLESAMSGLTERLRGAVRVEAADPEALQAALSEEGIHAELDNGHLRVHGVSAERIGEIAFKAHVALRELTSESASLEDVFLELTSEDRP